MSGRADKPAPAQAQAVRKGGLSIIAVLIGIIVAAGAGFALPMLAKADTPLGVPLPAVPPPQFEILPRSRTAETSVPKRRTIEAWLPKMALEADGLPPLMTPFRSDAGDFSIEHPYGAQIMGYGAEDILNDGVIAQVSLQFELPISVVKYSVPTRQEGESLTEYTARLRHELEQKGARFHDRNLDVEVEYYRFEQLQFDRDTEEYGPAGHYLFIGPMGKRALVIDAITKLEDFEDAAPLAQKVVNSFKPGKRLSMYVIEEFPELAPEGYTPRSTGAK